MNEQIREPGAAISAAPDPMPAEAGEPKKQGPRRLEKKENTWLAWLFFPAALLYHELLLRAFNSGGEFFSRPLLPIVLFAAAGGLALRLLLCLLPGERPRFAVSAVLTLLWTVLVGTEYCLKSFFKIYFGVSYIAHMTNQVVGDFAGTMLEIIAARVPFILLDMIPFVLLILWRKKLLGGSRPVKRQVLFSLAVLVLCQAAGSLWGILGPDKQVYRSGFTTDAAVPRFGLLSAVRLEGEYALFGLPQPELEDMSVIDEVATDHPQRESYEYNAMDLGFMDLYNRTGSSAIKSLCQYFSNRTPSQKNEYTGLFAGKNLILITAESFSSAIIDPELTPTLYKLTHTGFVMENAYQPGWGQSTTGGEFAVMTGIIPTWVNNNLSFYVSARDDMPFALGNQLRRIGYDTYAYHNNSYNYYNRDITHPNLGYDYHGVGTGVTVSDPGAWPYSDLEMLQQTIPAAIENSKATGRPFHTYYMTVSGHANWGWGNSMSAKHRQRAVEAYPNASQTVQGYVAANLELEDALTYLIDTLTEQGVLDDTVICMMADHYPYAMNTETADYYNELRGMEDTERDASRYKNALILWNSAVDTVRVSTPCSAIDIVPTLSNLFGLEYDSRLLSGHDIFATNYAANRASTCMPLVILPGPDGATKNWITAAGSYNAYTGEFTPNPGIVPAEGYVDTVNRLVDLQYTYARMLIQYDFYGVLLGDTAADGREVIQAPPPAAVPEEGGAEEMPSPPPAETPADVPQEPTQSGEEG